MINIGEHKSIMFDFLSLATDKFTKYEINGKIYVNAGKFKDIIIKIHTELKKNISLPGIVVKFNLGYIFFDKKKPAVLQDNVTMDMYTKTPRKYQIFVLFAHLVDNVSNRQDNTTNSILNNQTLSNLLMLEYSEYNKTNNIEEEKSENIDNLEEKSKTNDFTMLYLPTGEECPVIDLLDHEELRTDSGSIIKLEFRGKRNVNKLLICGEDIAVAFGLGKYFIRDMNKRDTYELDNHYIILERASIIDDLDSMGKMPECSNVDNNTNYLHAKNRLTYFTWFGFMKVTLSNNKNSTSFKIKMTNWIINTMFTHQFGNVDERQMLANELMLYKTCLNDLTGVYLVRIGKVKDLRESMKISYHNYPEELNNTYIYKYGRPNNILKRFKDHLKNYGKYSDYIQLTWFAILPHEKDKEAELKLKDYFNSNNLQFDFISEDSKRHDELIILDSEQLKTVNLKYVELISKYPSAENEIAMIMDKARSEFIKELTAVKHALTLEINKRELEIANHDKTKLEYENKLKDKDILLKDKDLEIKDIKITVLEEKLNSANIQMRLLNELTALKLTMK
jgi:hypothetical protein